MGIGRSIVVVLACLLLLSGPAGAALVSYSTAGSFNGGGNSITFGSVPNELTVTFTGLSTTVDADPATFASLGEFSTSVTGTGATITPGTTFDLNITQTAPGAGAGVLTGTLSGVLSQNSSTGMVTMSLPNTLIGFTSYSLTSNPIILVPPSTNNGVTTVEAQVVIPEPATWSLLAGAGLLALRRRR